MCCWALFDFGCGSGLRVRVVCVHKGMIAAQDRPGFRVRGGLVGSDVAFIERIITVVK